MFPIKIWRMRENLRICKQERKQTKIRFAIEQELLFMQLVIMLDCCWKLTVC